MRRIEQFTVTGGRPTLSIDIASGTVEIRAVGSNIITVNLDTDQASDWDISQLGDLVSVRSPRRRAMRNRSAKIYVEAPTGTHVEMSAASADVSLVGSLGDVRVRTASGDVKADEVQGLDIGTASGDVRAKHVAGRCVASTASGDVVVDRCGGDLEASTASGDVRVACCQGDAITVKAVSGDIALGLPSGIRVDPDISTLSGRTRLPSGAPAGTDAPRRPVRVRLRTVSGDITIDRAD